MSEYRRIALAVAIAPLAAAPVVFAFTLPDVGLAEFPAYFVTLTPFAYAAALLGGIPVHLSLRAARLRSPLLYLVLGGGLAALAAQLVAPWARSSDLVFLFLAGCVSGVCFWVIAIGVPEHRDRIGAP